MKWPKNFASKLGSLLSAILLWMAFTVTPDVVTTLTVPLLYQNLGKDFLVANDSPENVRVEVRGPSGQLTRSNLGDTVALVDLAEVKAPGERTLTIAESNLNLPRNVAFLHAVPSQLRLQFDRMARQQVPVAAKYSAGPAAGWRIASQSVTPPTLRVMGSETRVAAIHEVETDPIDLSGVTGTREFRVNAFVGDARLRFESSSSVTVRVVLEATGSPR